MNIADIIAKLNKGEALTEEETRALNEHIANSHGNEDAISEQLRAAADSFLAPFLEAQRSFNPAATGAQGAETPSYRVNAVSDLVHAIYRKDMSQKEMIEKGLTEGTSTAGGYLVAPQYVQTVLERMNEYGVAMADADVQRLGTNNVKTPKVSSGTTGYWVDEAGSITESHPVLSQLDTTVKKLAALSIMSNELLDDQFADIESILSNENAIAFAYALDYQMFRGTGSPFTGILGSSSVEEVTIEGGLDALDIDDLEEIVTALTGQKLAGARWYAHRKVFSKLRSIKDLDGNPIYHRDLSAAAPSQLMGFPVRETEVMPSTPAGSDSFLVLTNMQRTTRMWLRNDMSVTVSQDATITDSDSNDINLFQTDQSAVRTIMRAAVELKRPEWIVVVKGA